MRSRSTTRDGRGELANAYAEKFKVWGELPRENSPRVTDDPGMRRSESSMRLRVRYRSGFVIGDQLVDTGNGQVMYLTGFFPIDHLRVWAQLVLSESPVAASA